MKYREHKEAEKKTAEEKKKQDEDTNLKKNAPEKEGEKTESKFVISILNRL
jgi:hypothetical protein